MTLDRLSAETGYIRDVLEKVYRLIALIGEVRRTPDLHGKVALKGGTALQSIHLGFRRLSVDVDFNYVGSLDKDGMERDRAEMRVALLRLFDQQGYVLDDERAYHSEHSFVIAYNNSAGNRDRIKFEINFSERLPALDLRVFELQHPFEALGDISVLSYRPEELFASKTRALVTRATPRDLFDVSLIASGAASYDEEIYRKLLIFYLCMTPEDVRMVRTDRILKMDERDVKRFLLPLLRKGGDRPRLEEMKEMVRTHLDGMLDFTPEELRFLDAFYNEGRFDQGALFGDIPVAPNLGEHPVIVWRLKGR
jgi:predicted nucleotidyltransferase component of viral defense system